MDRLLQKTAEICLTKLMRIYHRNMAMPNANGARLKPRFPRRKTGTEIMYCASPQNAGECRGMERNTGEWGHWPDASGITLDVSLTASLQIITYSDFN